MVSSTAVLAISSASSSRMMQPTTSPTCICAEANLHAACMAQSVTASQAAHAACQRLACIMRLRGNGHAGGLAGRLGSVERSGGGELAAGRCLIGDLPGPEGLWVGRGGALDNSTLEPNNICGAG